MTDNEKAATFIGWKPDEDCGGAVLIGGQAATCTDPQHMKIEMGGSGDCSWASASRIAKGAHTKPAPDMTDPRNYMKALEQVVEPENWHHEFSRAVYLTILGHKPSPIIAALAALYDSEHPKSNAGS